MAHENDWVSIKEATPTTKRYLKLSHTVTLTFTGGSYSPSVSYDLPQSAFRQRPSYGYYYGTGSLAGALIVPSQLKVYQCQYDFNNALLFSAMNSSRRNYFVNGISGIENVNIDPTSGSLHYESELGDDTSYASKSGSYYVMQCEIDMEGQTAPSEDGSTTITFSYIFEFEENETAAYDAVVAAFPNNTSEYFIGVGCVPFRQSFPDMIESINPGDLWVQKCDRVKHTDNWINKDWGDPRPNFGSCVWTVNGKTYYSDGYNQQEYDKNTGAWKTKTWNGFSSVYGDCIWILNGVAFYSDRSTQYMLDETTDTWIAKSWTGLTNFYGYDVWFDDSNVYWSNGTSHYVLDPSTSTWTVKSWTGLTNFYGRYIWNYKEKIYYSDNATHYVLNSETSNWTRKTWNGISRFTGDNVWKDGDTVYSANLNSSSVANGHRVLNPSTMSWENKNWSISDITILIGKNVYTIGDTVYLTSGYSTQYQLENKYYSIDPPYRLDYPELIESINPYSIWVIDDDIPYRLAYPAQIESANPGDSWYISDDIPYRLDYPPLIETINRTDVWLLDNDIPYRLEYPEMKKSVGSPTSWLQTNGYEPYRPWPNHKTIFQTVEPVEVPSVDWSKGMQQTFEYYTVDPNTWYDVTCLTNIISCSLTHDSSSEMRGHASITTSEPLDENYIRIYMRVRQNGINQRFCLGTYLFIVSSDSFNGKRHSYTYTGYTPLIELKEKLAPLGYNVIGITGEKPELLPPRTAPTVTDEISRVIGQYSRLKLENNVLIERPLLNNFVSGTSDTWLAVINNLLTASTLQQYELSVDNWGAVRIKEAITVYNEKHVYEYDDGNSSILLPTLDLTDDMTDIPNVVEVIYTGNGNKDIGYVRKVVKNEDTRSIVSIPSRGREIWRRFVISNIAIPLGEVTRDMIEDQVEAQAKRLLEAASTIRKTIQYSHGFNGVEVGDTVLFNYERAGFTGIKAKVVSQTISCKPGCQVDETAVYTKRLWNRN